jgi:hypothetical protein
MVKYWIIIKEDWYHDNHKLTGQILKEENQNQWNDFGYLYTYYRTGNVTRYGAFSKKQIKYLGDIDNILESTDF